MIQLTKLSEIAIANLIKKGGMLVYSLSWKRYQEPGCSERFLVLKTRKKNYTFDRRVTLYNINIQNTVTENTAQIWRTRCRWAYIPPTSENQ